MCIRMVIRQIKKRKLIFLVLSIIIIPSVIFLFCIFSPIERQPHSSVLIDTTELRNGDLLFRNGNGGESRLITSISNGDYSHIAMAYRDLEGWKAVHAVPGETENIKDTDYLKSEAIEDFYKYERANGGAIAKVNCHDSLANKALAFALDKVKRKFVFDHNYRLADTTEYYCTELIYQAYITVGINLADDRRHELPMPSTEGRFIFPSDILCSPHISSIKVLPTAINDSLTTEQYTSYK